MSSIGDLTMAGRCGKELAYTILLCLGSLTFGFVIAFTSPARPKLAKEFPNVSEDQHTIYNAITSLTGIAGPFIVKGLLASGFGRQITTFVLAITGTGFWLLLLGTSGKDFWIGIIARALLGLTIGSFSAIVPMYVVELAPPDLVGFFGSFPQLFIASGVFLVNLLGKWLTWRELVVVGTAIDAVLSIVIWFVPESPATEQERNLPQSTSSESICSSQWIGLTIAGCLFLVFQQLSGVNAILTNQADLFKDVGIDPNYAAAISSSAQVIACLAAGSLIQLFGRKLIWIISLATIAVTDAFFGITQKPSIVKAKTFPPIVPVIVIFLNLLGFGLGAGPIPWFIVPDMFPISVRASAVSVATCTNWVFSFAVIAGFPALKNWMGLWATFFIFAVVSVIGVVFGVVFVKNTSKFDSLPQTAYDDLVSQ
jgi:MFS family permease